MLETKYAKNEQRLAGFFLDLFHDCGHNSSGYGPLPTRERRLPYVATIWTEGPRSFSAGDKSRFTDIVDPLVQARLRRRVRDATTGHADNRYCLGYVFVVLPVWHPKPKRGESYGDFVRSLDPGSPGRKVQDSGGV